MKSAVREQTSNPVTVAETKVYCEKDVKLRTSERWAGHRAAGQAAKKAQLGVKDTSVSYYESGAPYFTHAKTRVNLSISHSEQRAVAAVSKHRVGVDIEKIRSRSESMLTYICNDREIQLTQILAASSKLTVLWTIKESVMKAAQKGLTWSPKKVLIAEIESIDNEVTSTVIDPDKNVWRVTTEIDAKGYVISIAIPCQNKE